MERTTATIAIGTLTAILLSANIAPLQAAAISGRLYNFGDSLSDDGKTYGTAPVTADPANGAPYSFPAPPYVAGRYSNGLMWTEYLANQLGAPQQGDQNFAFGGATARVITDPSDPFQSVFNFDSQITLFEQAFRRLGDGDLVTVSFGGNDLPLIARQAARGEVALQAGLQRDIDAVIDGLDRLAKLGGSEFLVANVADLSLVPFIDADPAAFERDFGASVAQINAIGDQFNADLSTALNAFQTRSGSQVRVLDVNGLFDRIVADPAAFGIANVKEECLSTRSTARTPRYNAAIDCRNPAVADATLFWDQNFHGTTATQRIIAEEALATLAMPVPEPASWTLLLGGLTMVCLSVTGPLRRR